MPSYKTPAAVGVVFSLAAFVLGIVMATIQEFVIGKLTTNADGGLSGDENITEEITVATLGVFQTTYDPTKLNEAQLSSSGFPTEKQESDTVGFPLLFPGQSNFVADILPLSAASLAGLGDLADVATAVLGEPLQAVSDLEFDTCDQYLNDADDALTTLFDSVAEILPSVPLLVFGSLATTDFTVSLPQISTLVRTQGSSPVTALYGNFLSQAAVAAATLDAANCGAFLAELSSSGTDAAIDTTVANCLISGYGTLDSFASLGSVTAVFAGCPGNVANVGQCLGGVLGGTLSNADTDSLFTAPTFVEVNDVCAALGCTTQIEYIGIMGTLLNGTGIEDLDSYSQGLLLWAGLTVEFAAEGGTTIVGLVGILGDALSTEAELPVDLNNDVYLPCRVVNTVAQDPVGDGVCNYPAFLVISAGLAEQTGNPAAGLLSQIGTLYGACASAFFSSEKCPRLVGTLFMNAAYQGPISNEELLTSAALTQSVNATYEVLLGRCEDDEIDEEEITKAQIALIVAIVCYALGFFSGLGAVLSSSSKGVILALAGILAPVGGISNIAALIIVRNAPVYDAVGGEPEFNSVLYESGIIPTLALIALVLSIVAGISFFISSFFACKEEEADIAEEFEAKEAAAVEAKQDPEAQAVAVKNPVAEEAEEEVKPSV
eukprot:snap_masked-scaffold_17-processed-gene-4.6-mRNA-1 protein AED:1.00 eAED:1.00 QI:0/-1/0/0/-1/1/1/0/660